MGRKPRKKSVNGMYHVILRGINKQTIFEDDTDRMKMLETITKYKEISNFELYGYCLMDNHIHLLIKENDESISKTIQRICSSYVYWYNNKYDRCGHLFQDRYRSETIDSARYFMTALRYIHQNPVKAGLASNVYQCQWTSLSEYFHPTSNLVDPTVVLELFSSDKRKAIELFSDYMQESNDDQCLDNDRQTRLADNEVKSLIAERGLPIGSQLQQMPREKRNTILLELKRIKGVSIRQLSRLTGIPKSVIDRVR